MPITALCPYCRAGGVRASEQAIGMSATCPKCGSSFTVVPTTDKPVRAVPPPSDDAPLPFAREVADTEQHAPAESVTEPSPVLTRVRTATATTTTTVADEADAETEPAFVIALGALVLFGVGMLTTFLPFGRFIALALTGLGAILGLCCLAAEGRARTAAAVALFLNAAAVAILLLAPGWVGLDPWQGPPPDTTPKGPRSVDHAHGLSDPAEWVEASKASWGMDDVRVSVKAVAYGPITLAGPGGARKQTKEPYLAVALRVSNEGVKRKIGLAGWATGDPSAAKLYQSAEKVFDPKTFDGGWHVAVPEDAAEQPGKLFPGKAAEVVLVFEPPAARPGELRLELPGDAVGVTEAAKFRIPGAFLTGRWGTGRR
jgi:hypothetical protein